MQITLKWFGWLLLLLLLLVRLCLREERLIFVFIGFEVFVIEIDVTR